MNFLQHQTFLHCTSPCIDCPDCGIKTVELPWARPGSGFTLLFEAFSMALAQEMPVKAVARLVGEQDTRIWRLIHHFVILFVARSVQGNLCNRRQRQRNYWTFQHDFHITAGIRARCMTFYYDMSPASSSALNSAYSMVDRFHEMKFIGDAVDQVRRSEQTEKECIKHNRYIWFKNLEKLAIKQHKLFDDLSQYHLKTALSHQIRLGLCDFWDQPASIAEYYLKRWYFWATHCRLEPVKQAAYTIKRHWDEILNFSKSKIT